MNSECCNAEIYWELWTCDKNPQGRTDIEFMENYDHGNSEDEGMTTCEDYYCNPKYEELQEELIELSPNYLKNHEVHERCRECGKIL